MNRKFTGLQNALDEALTSCRTVKATAEEEIFEPGDAAIPALPVELARQTVARLKKAADKEYYRFIKTPRIGNIEIMRRKRTKSMTWSQDRTHRRRPAAALAFAV